MRFIHYKGGEYEFIGLARVEATGEVVVVYRSCATGDLWTRPEAEFFGDVAIPATEVWPNDRPSLRSSIDGTGAVVRRFIPAPMPPKVK